MITTFAIKIKNNGASIKSAQGRATTKAKERAREVGATYIGIMGYDGYIKTSNGEFYKFKYEIK